jgi:hypothetical protein
MGVEIETSGNFPETRGWLQKLYDGRFFNKLDTYGQMGVAALAASTPKETGLTAASWTYAIESSPTHTSIKWINTNAAGTSSVAILLQYGHGTGTGGYVQGIDYVNPAMESVFDAVKEAVMEEVSK